MDTGQTNTAGQLGGGEEEEEEEEEEEQEEEEEEEMLTNWHEVRQSLLGKGNGLVRLLCLANVRNWPVFPRMPFSEWLRARERAR
jgi:hypothetical protein